MEERIHLPKSKENAAAVLTLVRSALGVINAHPDYDASCQDMAATVRDLIISDLNDTIQAAYVFAEYLDELEDNGA
jgi:hypothetical protein